MTVWYVDLINGNNANPGTSFANRKKDISSCTPAAGDAIKVMGSTAPTSMGNALWTHGSTTVSFATPATKTISTCESNWTAVSGSVTCTLNSSDYRQGSNSQQVAIANAVRGSTRTAYLPLGSTDFSAYNQVTFWIKLTSGSGGTYSASSLSLCLCSDSFGLVIQNTLTIPIALSGTTKGVWVPVTVDHGSGLYNAVQSVALYSPVNPGAANTILLDNIEACLAPATANSINLNSLISKNSGTETWYAVRSVVTAGGVTTVVLDTCPGTQTSFPGYGGVTENVTSYKRETIRMQDNSLSAQTTVNNGLSTSPIYLTGGWDSTNMTTQTSETWMDFQSCSSNGLTIANSYYYLDKIYQVRCNTGFQQNTAITGLYGNISANNCFITGIGLLGTLSASGLNNIYGCVGNARNLSVTSPYSSINNIYNCDAGYTSGMSLNSVLNIPGVIQVRNNTASVTVAGLGGRIGTIIGTDNNAAITLSNTNELYINSLTVTSPASANTGYAVDFRGPASVYINNLTTADNLTGSLRVIGPTTPCQVSHYINNPIISEPTKVFITSSNNNQRVYLQNQLGVLNSNKVFTDGGNIVADTASARTSLDYKISVTSTTRTSLYPITYSLARVASNAGTTVTFVAYIKKSHASNISADMLIMGGQQAGVSSDLTVSATTTAYAAYTLTYSPTQDGVLEVLLNVYSTTGSITDYVQVADLLITST